MNKLGEKISAQQVFKVAPKMIDLTGLRDLDEAQLAVVQSSMKELGQLTPVELRKEPGNARLKLVFGLHRVTAAIALDWADMDAVMFEGTEDEARLREIDENLARVELSAFDQANFLAERRELWEKLHGESKRGGDRRSKAQVAPLIEVVGKPKFIKETAAAFGVHPATIKRALRRRAHIIPALWARLKHSEAAKNGALLDKISKQQVDTQDEILAVLKERGCKVAEAVRLVTAMPAKDPEVARYDALLLAWERASPEQRTKFLAEVSKQQKTARRAA